MRKILRNHQSIVIIKNKPLFQQIFKIEINKIHYQITASVLLLEILVINLNSI